MAFQRFVDVTPSSVAYLETEGEYFVLVLDTPSSVYTLYRGPKSALQLQRLALRERIATESMLWVDNAAEQISYEDNGVTAQVTFDNVNLTRLEPSHFTLLIDRINMTAVLSRIGVESTLTSCARLSPRRYDIT